MKDVDLKLDGKAAEQSRELAKAAFEKAIANMKDLAETAHKANSDAYEIVSARVKESVSELRSMAEKMKS